MLSAHSVDCCVSAMLHILNPDWIEMKRREIKRPNKDENHKLSLECDAGYDTKYPNR